MSNNNNNNKSNNKKQRQKRKSTSLTIVPKKHVIWKWIVLFGLSFYWIVLITNGTKHLHHLIDDITRSTTTLDGTQKNVSTQLFLETKNMNRLQEQQQKQQNDDTTSSASMKNHPTNKIQNEFIIRRQQQRRPLLPSTIKPAIPLIELINTDPNPTCTPGNTKKRLFESTMLLHDDESQEGKNTKNDTAVIARQIPRIIHMTSKSRCMTRRFIQNIDLWRFPNYSLLLHDDAAVDRLLYGTYWPEFPHIRKLQSCMVSGAAKADLWRYLILWEYGGIYTDIDNAPGKKLRHGEIISNTDEAFFVIERLGIPSQYFMASTPHHPFFYLCVMICLDRLLAVDSVTGQYVPYVTGPGVIKAAMNAFLSPPTPSGMIDTNGSNNNNEKKKNKKKKKDKRDDYSQVQRGIYVGMANYTITIAGSKQGASHAWVERESVNGIEKIGGYASMGMQHFSKLDHHMSNNNNKNEDATYHQDEWKQLKKVSCYEHLYNQEEKKKER